MQNTYILGISAFYHDSAAALVKDGEIVAAAQEERFTRKKHDFSFPENAIHCCLREAKINTQDLKFIAFHEKPFLKFDRILYTYLAFAPIGLRSFLKAMPMWLSDKLFLKDFIKKKLNYKGEIIFLEHHESHAAAAFFPSPFREAAILTMDGVGEWATTTYGEGKDNKLKLYAEIRFPHSLGLLYSAFTYYCGFKVNSGEYKLMGLAPYGKPRYADLIKDRLIDIKEDGSFRLNMDYFNYCAGLTMTNSRFHRLFGLPPRQPKEEISQRYMDIAHSIQDVTEEIMLKLSYHVYRQTKQKFLCLSGGVALNCVGNGRILKEGPFDRIWIQPAAGDAGSALGAALFVWFQYLDQERFANGVCDMQKASLLGPEYLQEDIERILKARCAIFDRCSEQELVKKAAELINHGKIIGWFEGRMEFGPRALGARSILADARQAQMQSLLNQKIKFRESFRPFAPSVLKEQYSNYFELSCPSPYMLLVADVKKEKRLSGAEGQLSSGYNQLGQNRSQIPAVTHVDYSARIQTVSKEENPLFYRLIQEFYKQTGCPVVINTSFNVRGEPIVCTPLEAFEGFMRTDMDFLFIGPFVLDKAKQVVRRDEIKSLKHIELD